MPLLSPASPPILEPGVTSLRRFSVPSALALGAFALLLPLSAGAAAQQSAGPRLVTVDPTGDDSPMLVPNVCFAEGTSEQYVADIKTALSLQHGWNFEAKYFLANNWSGATEGSPFQLTWSLVPDGLSMEGGNSNTFARMNTLFAGNQALWISKFQAVFDRWEAVCGVDFVRVTAAGVEWDDGASWGSSSNDTTRGDIRLGMVPIDGSNGVLAFTYFPGSGIGGNMAIDTAENWAQGAGNDYRFFRNTISHELGHAMGFDHVCPTSGTKLMEPFISTSYNGPRHDDVRAAQRRFGDDAENDNTSATAFDVGALTGTTVALGAISSPVIANTSSLSIDANGEQDWFKFTVNSGPNLTLVLTPVGLTYNSVSENNCGGSSNVDSLAMDNLAFEVRSGATGATVLLTVDATAAGSAESLVNFGLPGTGTYFVRAFEQNSPTGSQLYLIDFNNSAFADVGAGKLGTNGFPRLAGTGLLTASGQNTLALSSAKPLSPAALFFGTSAINAPFKGGTLVPSPMLLNFFTTDGGGAVTLPFTWPTGIPAGVSVYWQYWITDAGATFGFSSSNALRGTTN